MHQTLRKIKLNATHITQRLILRLVPFPQILSKEGGTSVGCQIRQAKWPARDRGCIVFCTTGIVLQWLRSSPLLDDVSHIILDEVRLLSDHQSSPKIILASCFLKDGPFPVSFSFILGTVQTENFRSQRESNSDRQNRNPER